MCEEALDEETSDKRRKEIIKNLCETTRLFGVARMFTMKQFFKTITVVERACRADIKLKGQLAVKEMIDSTDVANYLQGIEKSNLRVNNKIVPKWL